MIIFLFLQTIAFAILLCILFYFLICIYDFINAAVPFVPIKKRALPLIIKALQLSPGCTVYDLGCGDGRVLLSCVRSMKNITAVGLELRIIPFLISLFQTKGLNIKIKRQDIFKARLTEATHIFCYLSNPAMEKLAEKFRDECRVGVRIVSCDFPLPNWKPKEIIPIAVENDKFAKTLFVYEMSDF